MTTNTNINWFTLNQTEARSAMRDAVNEGTFTFRNIELPDLRKLINGEEVDGIKWSIADLRTFGNAGSYTHPVTRDELEARQQAPFLSNGAATTPRASDYNSVSDTTAERVSSTSSVMNERLEPTPQPAPAVPDIGKALQDLQSAVIASQRPSVDRNEVMQIAMETMASHFQSQFEKAVKSNQQAFDAAIVSAVNKFSTDEMKATVSALMQAEFGGTTHAEIKSGDKTLLPPIRPLCKSFRENPTTKKIEQVILSRFHLIVSGPSGSGKTYPVEQVLNKLGRRYIKISCADGLSMTELLAEKTIEVENGAPVMKVLHKALPICVKEGIALIMDEGDQLAGEILAMLNPVTDSFPATLTIPQTGEVIQAHKDFIMILTCNGLTDESGLYSGHQISGALKTRVRFVYADYLSTRDEVSILTADGLTQSDARNIVDRFKGLRVAHEKGILTMPPSTRTMLSISKAMQGKDAYGDVVAALPQMSLDEALEMTVLDALPQSERKAVTKLLAGN